MADSFEFDLRTLVRICLNDPQSRPTIEAAIADGPMPVREPFVQVTDGERVFIARIRTDREKAPGEDNFLPRDARGWFSGVLTEVVASDHEAQTMSQDQLAAKMGISVEELADRLKPNI